MPRLGRGERARQAAFQGDGCGFCYDPSVKSTVRIAGQRAKGKLSYTGDNRGFNIDMDVPIAPKEWGKPIAGDAGEIGKAYRAYNAAMQKDDRKTILKLLRNKRFDKR